MVLIKGRHVTMRYLNILIKIDKEHRHFIGPGQSISSIYIVVKSENTLGQGWPHFLCNGQKNGFKKLGGHKNVSKKAWRAKLNL